MNNLKNLIVIGVAVAFLIFTGLTWNYTEAIKAKNEIERERIASKTSSDILESEYQQKERCLKLKGAFQKKQPLTEGMGISTVEDIVIYNKKDNTCYLYTDDLSLLNHQVEHRFSIVDLLKEDAVIWYPSAGQWTLEAFLEKKKELGF